MTTRLQFAEVEADPLHAVLKLCAAAAPAPWYPREYARLLGVERDSLDPFLEQLRLGGLIRLTEWTADAGQGYALTPAGEEALRSPRRLDRLSAGEMFGTQTSADEFAQPNDDDRRESVRESPPAPITPYVTRLLVAVNIGVFLYGFSVASQLGVPANQYLSGGAAGLVRVYEKLGVARADFLLANEWWRLLANCFVHFGLLHLGMNMFALFSLGRSVERLWGHARFLIIYLLSGLGGSCAAMLFSPHAFLAGASGAICGLLGAEAVWVVANRHRLRPGGLSAWLRNAVVNVVLLVLISSIPNVSASAHFGGLAIGAFASLLLHWQRYGPPLLRWLALLGVISLPLCCIGALLEAPRFNPIWAQLIGQAENDSLGRLQRQSVQQDRDAQAAYRDVVRPVLDRHSSRRDPSDVEKAVSASESQRTRFVEIATALTKAGPFHDQQAEARRKGLIERFQVLADFFSAAADYLKQNGDRTEPNAKPVKEQMERVRELAPEWRPLLQ